LAGDPDPLENTVNVHATIAGFPNELDASASASTELFQPNFTIDKTGNEISKVGDTVTYEFTITNTSSEDSPALNLLSITDTLLGDISAQAIAAGGDVLSYGETVTFSIDRVVLGTDPDPLVNTVTAVYQVDGFPNQLTREDSHSVDLVHPNTEVTITPDVWETVPGGNVILTITEKNTGDWPLENVYVVLDPGAITLDNTSPSFDPTSDIGSDGILSPDETWRWVLDPMMIYEDTTFVVNGFGNPVGLPNIISYENGYELERAEVTVKVVGATRTIGFWKTHLDFTTYVFETYLSSEEWPNGHIYLGEWGGHEWDIDSIEELMGVMWANPANNCDGTKRLSIDQARILAAQQAIGAILNNAMPGGGDLAAWLTSHGINESIVSILEGNNINKIHQLQSALDGFNNSGDDIAFDPSLPATGRANPTGAREIADICWANTTPAPSKGKGKT
jgi:uncharacterized repeat protein (TIGR01451 family)